VRARTLLTAAGETISYKILVIATGARVYALVPLLGPTGAALGFRLMENGCVQFEKKNTCNCLTMAIMSFSLNWLLFFVPLILRS
jgi:hypothetical protein